MNEFMGGESWRSKHGARSAVEGAIGISGGYDDGVKEAVDEREQVMGLENEDLKHWLKLLTAKKLEEFDSAVYAGGWEISQLDNIEGEALHFLISKIIAFSNMDEFEYAVPYLDEITAFLKNGGEVEKRPTVQ